MKRKRWSKLASSFTALALVASFGLFGCGSQTSNSGSDTKGTEETAELDYSDWDAVVEAARGTTVTYYGYDGNQDLNKWINEDLATALKEKYDITLNYISNDSAMTALTDSLAAGSAENNGAFDITWTNGTGFKDIQELEGWFGPITELLPNFKSGVDPDYPLVTQDFGYDNQGYEAPFGFYVLNLIKNDELAPGNLATLDDFKALCEANPGKFTYPSSENWVGAAFIRTVIYNCCDYEKLMTIDPEDTEGIKEIIQPALDYLTALNPYLWNEGRTFPATNDEMTQLVRNGEIYNDVLYDQYGCGAKINSGEYPAAAHSYILDKTTANFSYWAIPYNSPNKAGALVAINEMLSPEQQLAKSEKSAGDVLDHSMLSKDLQSQFDAVDHGPNNVSDEALTAAATAEYSADVETAITQIWLSEVVGK